MEERVSSARLGECQTEASNLARQAGVDHLRSETDDETADEGRIHTEVDVDLVGAGHGLLQAVNAGDAVAHGQNGADMLTETDLS